MNLFYSINFLSQTQIKFTKKLWKRKHKKLFIGRRGKIFIHNSRKRCRNVNDIELIPFSARYIMNSSMYSTLFCVRRCPIVYRPILVVPEAIQNGSA